MCQLISTFIQNHIIILSLSLRDILPRKQSTKRVTFTPEHMLRCLHNSMILLDGNICLRNNVKLKKIMDN